MCTGNILDQRIWIEGCPDLTTSGQTERCNGPAETNPTHDNNPGCSQINYPNSFETRFSLPDYNGATADGICNDNYQCSSQDQYPDLTNGIFAARGGCGNGECGQPIQQRCSDALSEQTDDPNMPQCHAECDDRVNDVSWIGNNCKNACNMDSCTFATHTTHCTQANPNCLYQNNCWSEECTPTAFQQTADYCPMPGTIVNENGHSYCYYGNMGCSNQGQCTLNQDLMPSGCRLQQCDPNSGWRC